MKTSTPLGGLLPQNGYSSTQRTGTIFLDPVDLYVLYKVTRKICIGEDINTTRGIAEKIIVASCESDVANVNYNTYGDTEYNARPRRSW